MGKAQPSYGKHGGGFHMAARTSEAGLKDFTIFCLDLMLCNARYYQPDNCLWEIMDRMNARDTASANGTGRDKPRFQMKRLEKLPLAISHLPGKSMNVYPYLYQSLETDLLDQKTEGSFLHACCS